MGISGTDFFQPRKQGGVTSVMSNDGTALAHYDAIIPRILLLSPVGIVSFIFAFNFELKITTYVVHTLWIGPYTLILTNPINK